MAAETLALLAPRPGETAVDGTVGLGGHSRLIGRALGCGGRLVCFDRDPEALALARENLAGLDCRVEYVNRRYEFMERELERLGIAGANRILLDLGASSLQFDKPERGFSFARNGPLDMRMDARSGPSAADVVNGSGVEELAAILRRYGDERFGRRIAKRIGEARAERPIETTEELSAIVAAAVPSRGKTHPATRVFQALRIFVNDEMGTLSRGLAAAGRSLEPGGRLAVLTFHSLEDRLVKRVFARWRELGVGEGVGGGVVPCGREEARANRRARSAKLRVVVRLRR